MAQDKTINTATIGNTAEQIVMLNRANSHQKGLAEKRNSTPVFAFIWGDKRHRELWGLSQIIKTEMNFVTAKGKERKAVYVGKLAHAIQELKVNDKGETKRGHVKPITFWYIIESGEYGAFPSATQEERDYIVVYVGGLMKKFLAGVAMIESGNYSACKGFDKRNDKSKEQDAFNRAYMNKKDATDEEINLVNEKTARATQAATPVNMD